MVLQRIEPGKAPPFINQDEATMKHGFHHLASGALAPMPQKGDTSAVRHELQNRVHGVVAPTSNENHSRDSRCGAAAPMVIR